MNDHYATLGVPRSASSIEIRDAYLKLARTTHPDTVKDPEERKKAEAAFKHVTAAYDTLSRDRSRREYDAKLPAAPAAPEPRRTAPRVVQGPPVPPSESPRARPSEAIATTGRVKFDALGQGIEAFKKKDYHSAVQLLNAAVSQNQNDARAHGMLALALAKNPNWIRDAMNHMETASRLEPKNASYLAELALLLHSQGLKLRARRTLENAIALNPGHPDVVRAGKEIPTEPSESQAPSRKESEPPRGLFDRLRKR